MLKMRLMSWSMDIVFEEEMEAPNFERFNPCSYCKFQFWTGRLLSSHLPSPSRNQAVPSMVELGPLTEFISTMHTQKDIQ